MEEVYRGSSQDSEKFTPTKTQRQRYEEYVNEYVSVMAKSWVRKNPEASIHDLDKAEKAVRLELSLPDRPEWMHPRMAIAVITSCQADRVIPANQRIDMLDAYRTKVSHNSLEWSNLVGESLGISGLQVRNQYADKRNADKSGRNARRSESELNELPHVAYRHYDAFGVLLYVGISMDKRSRDFTHKALSPWWKYSTTTEMEVFNSRREAKEREKRLIISLDPIFNEMHSSNQDRHRRQSDYLTVSAR